MSETINRKDLMAMKLLHYFITEKNYSPIILQGADDEIWLENLDSDYKIVRIVSNYIHNDEQLNFDLFKTKKIATKIKKKVFSFSMKVLNIYTDLGDNVHLDKYIDKDCVYLYDESYLEKSSYIQKLFPDMISKFNFSEEGLQLFIKITNDINQKNKKEAEKAEDIFKKKKPIVTWIFISLMVITYFGFILLGIYDEISDSFSLSVTQIRDNSQYYRLITYGFLHTNIFHLMLNCYSVYILGSQLENFMGKVKYIIICLFSLLMGSLMTITFSSNEVIGFDATVFGIIGSLLYFGYHYRIYLGTTLKSQIIPLLLVNLLYQFLLNSFDNIGNICCLIGGLIGGLLITMSLGIKYKSNISEKVNGTIITIIFTIFMIYMSIFIVK